MVRVATGLILLWAFSSFCQAEDLKARTTGAPQAVADRKPGSGYPIEDLLQRADHLEQSGLIEEAAKTRAEARESALEDNLLEQKEAELAKLQAEVDRIRNLTGNPRAVLVKVTAIEVRRSKLGDKAGEFERVFALKRETEELQGGEKKQITTTGSLPGIHFDLRNPLFDELGRRQAIAIIAEPTLITTSGRRASFLAGGQFAVPTGHKELDGTPAVHWKSFGVQLDVTPVVLAEGRIRLRAEFEVSEKDKCSSLTVHGHEIPSLTTRAVNTEIEVQDGQTLVLGRMRSARYPGEPRGAVAKEGGQNEGVKLVGTSADGSSSLSGTIVVLSDEKPAPDGAGEGADHELIVLITAELANRPETLRREPSAK